MTLFICGLVLAAVSALLIVLRKAYSAVPAGELKRRARASVARAAGLYRVAAYGPNVQLLLAVLIGLASAGSFVLLVRAVQPIVAFAILALVVWVSFVWLPATTRLQQSSQQLAAQLGPMIAKLLSLLYPLTHSVTNLSGRGLSGVTPSDLYETEDLLNLLKNQKQALHNRIPERQLEAATRVLQFTHRQVADVMLPQAQAKLVSAHDVIGPLLLDELHDSGKRSFLVYEDKRDHLVGSISLHDALGAPQGAKASDVMRPNLCFVNEDQSLEEVLRAFQVTRQPIFAVVNRANDFVGIIGIDHLLAEALGEVTEGEPLAYEDRNAMAAYQPQLEPIAVPEDESPQELPDESEQPLESVAEESEISETLPPEPPEVVE